jgi:hypothetical protein
MVESNPWLRDRRDPKKVAKEISRGRSDKVDGWWISEVLDRFAFLERDFGYHVDEVYLHFRGSHVRFASGVFDLVVGYDPQDTGHVSGELWVRGDLASEVDHPRALALNDILSVRQPSVAMPDTRRANLGRSEVLSAISTWSAGLRDVAPDVLRGTWPDGVAVSYLW